MATLTIRNLPEDTVELLKQRAKERHHSMEQEVRLILLSTTQGRSETLARIKKRWKEIPKVNKHDVDSWIDEGRSRGTR